ncbi:Archaeal DNA polymerase II small subunit [Methanosarcina sp. MTP4]|uniref:DNA-directed DNA polymerase II small subunit n=1 Tax=Methanosarcina sp. MTP4 TaxID=1434100 RepID=UPI000615E9DE|nr:DNA-directed DNA polymerase II small subunit [Methanosarcina sp. MTP4]AKB26683.1 Archaeal DNA polymerase II small subunit [Methanosarcina sp. MTP4]
MNEINIIRAVAEEGYQISPEAAELIKASDVSGLLLEYVLSTIDESVFVIEAEHIDLAGFAASRVERVSGATDVAGATGASSEPAISGEDRNVPGSDFGRDSVSDEIERLSVSGDPFLPDAVLDPVSDQVPDSAVGSKFVPVSGSVPGALPDPASGAGSDPVLSAPSGPAGRANSASGSGNSLLFSAPFPASRDRPFSAVSSGMASGSSSPSSVVRSIGGPNPVTVLSDITGHSTCVGEYMQFVQYFRDRYSRLSEIIRGRINARPIESLKGRSFRRGGGEKGSEEISIIGMVSDTSTTTNGHRILSLEDPTGSFPVLVRNSDKDLFELASSILLDEVIGVTGSVTNDGGLMMASKIIQPDVPNSALRRTGAKGKVVLISDVHVGSAQFMEDSWLNFLDFLKGDSDSEALKKMAEEVRYLVVAGDLVDGIGIYPDQDKELTILDVYEQYRKAAEYFWEIPKHIQIIISPGNHDAVRQAEPQPALPERIREHFPPNITFVGNPALVDLDGVSILIYHGRSIDDLVASVPGVSYQEPAGAVLEMIKRRHLAPTYGSRVSISPEKKDYFIIDPVPDIIHTGHVHTLGVQRYKNVLLVNSGTWQSQTEFQKRVNLMPVPAQVPVVDLADFGVTILKFDE